MEFQSELETVYLCDFIVVPNNARSGNLVRLYEAFEQSLNGLFDLLVAPLVSDARIRSGWQNCNTPSICKPNVYSVARIDRRH